MADEHVSLNVANNPDPQEKPVPGDGITHSPEQQIVLAKPPKSLLNWLVCVHMRLLAP